MRPSAVRSPSAVPGSARANSSSYEPMHSMWSHSPQTQSGSGVPQYRSREIAQSTLPASHSPKRPSWMWPGTQWICSFSATIESRTAVVRKYHEGFA